MVGDAGGGEIHTWSSSEHNQYNIANNQYAYSWPQRPPTPWSSRSSTLEISFLSQVPTLYLEGKNMAAYVQLSLYLRGVNGGAMWYLVSVFDNRGRFSEVSTIVDY